MKKKYDITFNNTPYEFFPESSRVIIANASHWNHRYCFLPCGSLLIYRNVDDELKSPKMYPQDHGLAKALITAVVNSTFEEEFLD